MLVTLNCSLLHGLVIDKTFTGAVGAEKCSYGSVGGFHCKMDFYPDFKALLFLSSGSIIHGLADEQDMRRMGGLIRFFPVTYIMFLIGSLALMGFPCAILVSFLLALKLEQINKHISIGS
jgi:NADH:ubiquinone oxidoreductase subunit 4 (subunit M)